MSVIGFLIVGLVAGALAKMILPGRAGGGWLATLLLGVIGALVGGFLGSALFSVGLSGFWSLQTWSLALAGSLIVLAVWGILRRGPATSDDSTPTP